MTVTTIEEIFGVKAGMVWEALNQNGPSSVAELSKATSLSREDVFGGPGLAGPGGQDLRRDAGENEGLLAAARPLIWPRNA